jgi:type IV pilus assembly protein PilO
MLRSRTSRWLAATTLVSVLLLVAGWFLLVSPQQAQASDLRTQNVAVQENNDLLELKIAELKAQFATLSDAEAELVTIQQQMPGSVQMPQLVRDLNQIAQESGVDQAAVTPADATLLSEESGASGSSQVVRIPLSLVVEGDYFQVVAYLQKLQTQLSRVVLVSGISITEAEAGDGEDSSAISVTITGSVFALSDGSVSTESGASSSSSSGPGSGASAGSSSGGTTDDSSSDTSMGMAQ